MKILILANLNRRSAQTITEHLGALEKSRHRVFVCDVQAHIPPFLKLEQFDVIVVHYTLVMSMDSYLSPKTREKLKNFKGLKACFIQDEYRHVEKTIEAIKYMGMHVIFTCVPPTEFEKVYSNYIKGIFCVNVLTGYVSEKLLTLKVPDYSQRTIDVSYRGRVLPYWLGALGQEKMKIAQKFEEDAKEFALVTDIDFLEKKRLYGKKWIRFLSNSKACLGVESGASVFDFKGTIQGDVESYIRQNPSASFEEVQTLFFKDLEGKIKLNQISPRCFEAASLRTMMILYEGDYSGVLIPWRHYVPLKKDHSNMKEIVEIIKDAGAANKIIDYAYEEVALNKAFSFQKLTDIFDETIEARFRKVFTEPTGSTKRNAKNFEESFVFKKYRLKVYSLYIKFFKFFMRCVGFIKRKIH